MKPKITRNIRILRIGGCARTERIGTPPFFHIPYSTNSAMYGRIIAVVGMQSQ